MKKSRWNHLGTVGVCVLAGLAANACGGDSESTSGGTTSSSSTSSGAGGGSGGAGTTSTGEGGSIFTTSTTSGGQGGSTTTVCDQGAPDDDGDADGFTEAQGDCNDCDANVNPGAVEVIDDGGDGAGGAPPGVPVDEDCDGTEDNIDPPCDTGLAQGSLDPMDAAKAIELCKFVTSAKWALADGTDPTAVLDATQLAAFHRGHGNLTDLGSNNTVWAGEKLLVLSSGTARKEGDPEFVHRNFDKKYQGGSPIGFPKEGPSCPGIITDVPHDAGGVEFQIKAPSNAQSFSFYFNFFTYEWPQYICTTWNDFFVANMVPFPAGQSDGNISFDTGGNPISVNNAFLDVCGCPGGPPCVVPPSNPTKPFPCLLGTTGVMDTDFDVDSTANWTNGSTGWLQTTAPVTPGQTFSIRLVTYDSSDGMVDSTTIIDGWKWYATPGTTITEVVPPPPPPN